MSWQGDERTHLFIPVDDPRVNALTHFDPVAKKGTVTDNHAHRRGCV